MSDAGRWSTYVLHSGQALREHWAERIGDGARVALVCGVGFDPRMCLGLELLAGIADPAALRVLSVTFPVPGDSTAATVAQLTRRQFEALTEPLDHRPLEIPPRGGVDRLARDAAGLVEDLEPFGDATDVVVDVNALPRAVFFPLVSKLLYLCDRRGAEAPNLHVLAGDAAWLDALSLAQGLDEHATWLFPYAGTFMSEADSHVPRIWMPVLGEDSGLALRRISDHVEPIEICPLLPFPSRDPRRGDRLFEQYREVVFERLRADSGTVLYAAEANPFQVYRRLRASTVDYTESLDPLGGCKVAFSALSSKLVALGVLLTAYELRELPYEAGVADIGNQQHRLLRAVSLEEAREGTELVGVTVSGDCYL